MPVTSTPDRPAGTRVGRSARTIDTMVAGPLSEPERRRGLRRMKTVATALLVVAAVVYAVTRRWQATGAPGWVGYLNAAAEAGMVGALADWFAVTALFRHPLGLPIPHTAIIPTKKDALGHSLEDFVATNFLSADVVRDKVHRVQVAGRLGAWLSDPAHARRVTGELATAVRAGLAVLRDEDVQEVLEKTVLRRVVDHPWGPPAGRLLGEVVREGTHHRLVDLLVAHIHAWLVANRDAVVKVVQQQAPSWSPNWVDDLVAGRVYAEVLRFAGEVRAQPDHPVRQAVDALLAELADDLQHDPATIERAEALKERLLAHPEVRQAVAAVWTTARRMLLDAVDDPESELRVRVLDGLVSLGERLAVDEDLRTKVDGWVEDATTHVVSTYRDEIATVISDTVNRWDARETSRKVELQVGRDLQFIRINGTVVGALAGLLIHAVTVTLL